ncbi:MAG: PIN domain protein [Acidobacteria bacterium]|nr:PIN domain protein [Acidobacteriota bacterium]
MKPRIYVDTSVLGGCEDAEFRESSRHLLDAFVRSRAVMVVSDLTLRELARAPDPVRRVLTAVPPENIESIGVTTEADELAQAYLAERVVNSTMAVDALHIALATVARVDVLVSWNFRHIVNLEKIHAFNAVNLKRGYPILEIRSPLEVFTDE